MIRRKRKNKVGAGNKAHLREKCNISTICVTFENQNIPTKTVLYLVYLTMVSDKFDLLTLTQ